MFHFVTCDKNIIWCWVGWWIQYFRKVLYQCMFPNVNFDWFSKNTRYVQLKRMTTPFPWCDVWPKTVGRGGVQSNAMESDGIVFVFLCLTLQAVPLYNNQHLLDFEWATNLNQFPWLVSSRAETMPSGWDRGRGDSSFLAKISRP